MTRLGRTILIVGGASVAILWARPGRAELLTADRAVQIALQKSTPVINAEATVRDARAGLYSAYSGVLPRVTADFTRAGQRSENQAGSQLFGSVVTPSVTTDNESYSSTPSLSGSWSLFNPSSLTGLSSARLGLKAARLRQSATRQEVAFDTRRQFYQVVQSVRLADVATGALRLARDDERRVRALFEVGSVSKSDVLKAQVRTAQSQLDSLTAYQSVISQRISLAELMGLRESELAEVDTVLTAEVRDYEEGALLQDAARARPDLKAVDAEWRAARAAVLSARLSRLPYVTVSSFIDFSPRRTFTQKSFGTFYILGREHGDHTPDDYIVRDTLGTVIDPVTTGRSQTDRTFGGQIALTWDLFNGFATDSRIASARARLLRADEARNALNRNLEAEVHQALLAYREAAERGRVATSSVESATENLKLTQQKYNVGSSTILDLIDAQVQLQRAQSDRVTALAGLRVAEAQIEMVRGRE